MSDDQETVIEGHPPMGRPRLDALRCPIRFVTAYKPVWREIETGALHLLDEARLAQLCVDSFTGWTLQTYVRLRQAGAPVSISSQPDPAAINIVDARNFGARRSDPDIFIVYIRGDAHWSPLAHFVLEQNASRVQDRSTRWVYFWPQPGLIPRDASRGDRIETLVFKGELVNLDGRFRSVDFLQALDRLGVRLITHDKQPDEPLSWHDYADCDLVLGARNLTVYNAAGKPASKLINAWRAGSPALLGPEPAYRELRWSTLDYVEVRTAQDVLEAVIRLRSTPGLYRAMIENGLDRARRHPVENVTAAWLQILNGPVADAFMAFRRSSRVGRRLRWLARLPAEALARPLHRRRYLKGRRILDHPASDDHEPRSP